MKLQLFSCLLLVSAVVCGGCAEVKPWQKGNLAKAQMSFDTDPLESHFRQHVYDSKEGSFGGYGVSAGGCGCN